VTERLLDTQQAAEALGIPADIIYVWKTRGLVMPSDFIRGRGRGGWVPMYQLEDLRPLAEKYLARDTDTRSGSLPADGGAMVQDIASGTSVSTPRTLSD